MVDSKFSGKKVLFFAPSFFNYENIIKEKLESLGVTVTLFDDRPSNSVLVKGLIRLKKKLLKTYINRYYNEIIQKCSDVNYDYVFFLKGESITVESIKKLKESFLEAKFILYLADSVKNNDNSEIYKHFDRILTFDKVDAINNSGFVFRPLFYNDLYKQIGLTDNVKHKYQMLFVGTVHADRFSVVKNIVGQSVATQNRNYVFMYMPSKILFWFRKLTETEFRKVKKTDISFKSLSHKQLVELLKMSRIVIDVQHPNQTGLTMRTLEILGAKKKLITTNTEIKKYDFFNKANICVVDRKNPKVDAEFLNSDYQDVKDDIYLKYSLETWLEDCLLWNEK